MTDKLVSTHERTVRPIKVLEITQASGGGVQKYVIQLCKHLDRNRFVVTGCCSTESLAKWQDSETPFQEAFEQAGVSYFLVPMERAVHPVKDLLALVMIYQRIKKIGFDIVHTHSSKAGVLGRIAARWAGVPVVLYSPHAFSFAAPDRTVGTYAFVLFEKIAAHFCDAIIADSVGERDLALDRGICRRDKIRVISPGVTSAECTGNDEDQKKSQLLHELGVPANHKIVTFIGRLAPQKDPLTFIRCAQHLETRNGPVSFLLVGDGPLRQKCAEEVHNSALHGKMKLLGWRRDYELVLSLSDVVIIPSRYEGLPFVLLEAMAQGKPVVAADVAGIREVIAHGKDGFLVPLSAPDLLAATCSRVLEDTELAVRVGHAARTKVLEHFTIAKAVSLTEEAYSQLLEMKRADHG